MSFFSVDQLPDRSEGPRKAEDRTYPPPHPRNDGSIRRRFGINSTKLELQNKNKLFY